MSNSVRVDVQGFQALADKVKELGDDKDKRREALVILRQVAKPTLTASRSMAPVSNKKHFSRGKFIAPGTLRKSLGMITGRSKNPTVIVGARAKGRFDGWYAAFVHEGHEYFASAVQGSRLLFKNNSRFTTVRNKGKGSAINKNRKSKGERARLRGAGMARRTKAQPFLSAAFEQTQGQVTADAEKRFQAFIQRRINKLSK